MLPCGKGLTVAGGPGDHRLPEGNQQAGTRAVSLLGAVRTPGSFEIKEGSTLATVMAQAGGPTPLADLRRITLTRSDQSVQTIDLDQTAKAGDSDEHLAPTG